MLWVQISIKTGVYNIMWSSLSVTCAGRWFSPGPPVFSTNKTHHHDINEIVMNEVALISIKQTEQRHDVREFFFLHIITFHCVIVVKFNIIYLHSTRLDNKEFVKIKESIICFPGYPVSTPWQSNKQIRIEQWTWQTYL